jgi:hypothetical protein
MVNRGDAHVFVASIHKVVCQLKDIEKKQEVKIPASVYDELSAMEEVLMKYYLSK